MRGERVVIERSHVVGQDAHHNAVFDTVLDELDNVLVAPQEGNELSGSTRPSGIYIRYTLYFPKTYLKSLEGCRIRIRGEWLNVIGAPDYFDPDQCPTDWNRVVYVGVTHG